MTTFLFSAIAAAATAAFCFRLLRSLSFFVLFFSTQSLCHFLIDADEERKATPKIDWANIRTLGYSSCVESVTSSSSLLFYLSLVSYFAIVKRSISKYWYRALYWTSKGMTTTTTPTHKRNNRSSNRHLTNDFTICKWSYGKKRDRIAAKSRKFILLNFSTKTNEEEEEEKSRLISIMSITYKYIHSPVLLYWAQ